MNQKIKAVVFDVGGVLCNWEDICREYASEIAMDYDKFLETFLIISFDPQTGSDLGYMTIDEFFIKLTAVLGVPEKAWEWRRKYVPGLKRIEPTYELLDELKGRFRLAVLTNSKIGLWDEWQEGNLRKHFDIIVDSSEVHVLKPDEKIYRILLERLGLKPSECLYIDDFPEYVAAAKKLGFKTVHFTKPEEGVKLIRKILYGRVRR